MSADMFLTRRGRLGSGKRGRGGGVRGDGGHVRVREIEKSKLNIIEGGGGQVKAGERSRGSAEVFPRLRLMLYCAHSIRV